MSDKNLSSAQGAQSEDSPDDKSKPTPAADRPSTQPDETPAEVAPTTKS